QPGEIGEDCQETAQRDHPVDCRRQLVHGGGGRRMPGHADREHENIAEPEGEAGEKADFCDVNRVQPVIRIDAETDRAAGEDGGADIVADRIGGEAGQRGDTVGNVLLANRSQRKKVIEGERAEREENAKRGESDAPTWDFRQRGEDDTGVDALEGSNQRGDREGDYHDARGNPEPSPADPSLEAALQRGQQSVHSSSRWATRPTQSNPRSSPWPNRWRLSAIADEGGPRSQRHYLVP